MSMNRLFSLCTPDEIFALSRLDETWRDLQEANQELKTFENSFGPQSKTEKKKNFAYRNAIRNAEMLDNLFQRLQHEFSEQFPDRQLILKEYLDSKLAVTKSS